MSNWFENNPTKSVLSYTLVIAGATWAISTFVLQDNRINLLRTEVDSQRSVAEQYKSKVELLQREIDTVRSENTEYRAWLGQAKDAIPIIVPRINDLKARIDELERKNKTLLADGASGSKTSSEIEVSRGRAYIDEMTGVVVTVLEVGIDRQARMAVKLPGKATADEKTVYAGWQWGFKSGGKSYTLTLNEVSFARDYVKVKIT